MAKRPPVPRWHSCDVFQSVPPVSRFWRFAINNGKVSLNAELELQPGQTVSPKLGRRGWGNLWHPQLNVAWLPPDQVYLRVVHLPMGEPEELQPMLDLQLEKLSPAPINQIVWTYQPVPHPEPEQQSAIVIIAERAAVEKYLGSLEQCEYLPDRLELPWLHHILSVRPSGGQTCLYLVSRDRLVFCLAAWWYGQVLQNVELFHFEINDAAAARVADQLIRVGWAGEFEGWLSEPPNWLLTASAEDLEIWAPLLKAQIGGDIETQVAPDLGDLAQLTAERGVRNEATANLLPIEFVARYRQQFIDRLWMRGVGAMILVYLFFVLVYFAGVQVLEHQDNRLRAQLAELSAAYTNALQLKEQVRVYAEQAELKYAALNSLRIASELLPTEITLTSFTFQGGRSLRLVGIVAPDQQARVTEYNAELRNASIDGTPLFDKQKFDPPSFMPQGPIFRWDFTAELNRAFSE